MAKTPRLQHQLGAARVPFLHVHGLHQPQPGHQLVTQGMGFKAAFAQPFRHGKGGQNPE